MDGVTGDDEGEREGRDFLAAGGAAAQKRGIAERADERNTGAADGAELLKEAREFLRGGIRGLDVIVLFEAGEGSLVAAGDAQQAIGEDTLGVVDVADDLLDGPFFPADNENPPVFQLKAREDASFFGAALPAFPENPRQAPAKCSWRS
jgi:hypothetical protein